MVPDVIVNYWAVLVAAIASMVLGAVWYSPGVFGKIWMKGSGMTSQQLNKAKKKGMGKLYFIAFLGSLLFAYILAHFVVFAGVVGVADALELAILTWIGFAVPLLLGSTLWEGKSWGAYLVVVVYQLVSISMMAIILAYWV